MTVTKPAAIQLSSPPLSGSFTITCNIAGGATATTAAIPQNAQPASIKYAIEAVCPQFKDKMAVWEGPAYGYNFLEGRDILIRFMSYNADPAQLTLKSASSPVLAGGDPSKPVPLKSTTLTPYSTNLFYDPIPFEWLYTNESTPQVIVTIDGQIAICASLQCGYTYTGTPPLITGFSLNGLTLTITGTSLATTGVSVSFA